MDALRELPEPMAPLRATDGPGARVIPPTPELFPGGSWERPWVAGSDGEDLALDYEAGGAFATVEGDGETEVELDGQPLHPIPAGRRAPRPRRAPQPRGHDLILRPAPV